MITEEQTLIIDNEVIRAEIDRYTEEDKESIIEIYDAWRTLSVNLNNLGCRKPNFPEISEIIFCFVYDCWRTNNLSSGTHTSFDCYNPKTNKTIQIKATSISNDLTSFGPKSVWEELYFLDFYNEDENGNANYNGDFKVYLIPNDEVYNHKMNKNQTFVDQQKEGRRPRFGIKKELITPLGLKPIGEFNIYNL